MLFNTPVTRERLARISAVVFVVMILLSGFLLSTPGNYWPWYAITAIFAIPPLALGPRRYRLFGIVALALSLILIIGDCRAGKRFRAKQQLHRASLHPPAETHRKTE
jgi:hypothetical protein